MSKCPKCKSEKVVKNGHIHNGKQRYLCRECGRQFVPEATKKVIPDEVWALVDRLLLEKLPLAGIARVSHISETWLQEYVNRKYQEVNKTVEVKEKKGH